MKIRLQWPIYHTGDCYECEGGWNFRKPWYVVRRPVPWAGGAKFVSDAVIEMNSHIAGTFSEAGLPRFSADIPPGSTITFGKPPGIYPSEQIISFTPRDI